MAIKFRTLTYDEVECRVGTCTENGVSLLLYKDARVDMKILDETVGAENWQRRHELVNGNLFCTVSIWDENKKMWIEKQDVGVESNTEKEKGQASDAFKRACTCWGIGRELYTAPFIWIGKGDCDITTGKNGKPTTKDTFVVSLMEVEDGVITKLIITNLKKRKVAYTYGEVKRNTADNVVPMQKPDPQPEPEPEKDPEPTPEQKALKRMWAVANEKGKTNEDIHEFIKKAYKKDSVKDLTVAEINAVVDRLQGKK